MPDDLNCEPEDDFTELTETEIQELEKDERELAQIAAEFPVSSEPELVVELSNDVASDLGVVPPETHLTSTVCDDCLSLNLTTKVQVITCERCGQPFCYHFTSNIDTRYCVNCMSNVSVTKQVISKEYIHRDENEKVTSVYRRNAREIKIDGTDWLFMQRKIHDMSDLEVDLSVEFHRNALMLLINEQELRRNAKMHRYAAMKKGYIPSPSDGSVQVSDSTTVTVKKTRTISKNKAQDQLNALLGSMLGGGKSLDEIAALLKGGK